MFTNKKLYESMCIYMDSIKYPTFIAKNKIESINFFMTIN